MSPVALFRFWLKPKLLVKNWSLVFLGFINSGRIRKILLNFFEDDAYRFFSGQKKT
jgi:hypothetical protein